MRDISSIHAVSKAIFKYYVLLCLILLFFFSMNITKTNAQIFSSDEYTIKAAFLYNFAKFAEWPAESFKDVQSPFVICILGKDPFGNKFDAISGKTIANRRITVKYANTYEDVGICHILFVSSSENDQLYYILNSVRNRNILTVGEKEGFCKSGGIINFFINNDKVRFEINPNAAARARIKISSKLLNLAKIFIEGKQ